MPIKEIKKFERISDEEISQILGGNISMIYKKGFRWYVWDPSGRLVDKFWLQSNALNCAQKLSSGSPGNESGAVKFLSTDDYNKKTKQRIIQKIV